MGFLSSSLRALVPAQTQKQQSMATAIPTWDDGREIMPPFSYDRNARDGYMRDEVVFECVEFRATSAGEPPICAYRTGSSEKVDQHPALDLLNHPNPFMGRSRFWSSVLMCQDIGGNAYVHKVRSAAGKVVELWPLRPDRIRVIPSAQTFVGAYRYTIGDHRSVLPAEDVIHFKTRHPLDDYYGLPPIAVGAERIDLDVWVRQFTRAFFQNAGVPSGLINIVRPLNSVDRELIRSNFRDDYSGPSGWFKPLVIDSGQATYQPMGLPLGESGLALNDLTQNNEVRICALYQVPPSLVPTLVGMNSASYANRVSDQEGFWENTMVPIFRDLDSSLTEGLVEEWPDLERLEHDLSTVKALQEDEDKKHERYRKDWQAKIITWSEARMAMGYPEKPDAPGMLTGPVAFTDEWSDDMLTEPEPEPSMSPALSPALGATGQALPAGQNQPLPQPTANGQRNGTQY